MALWCILGAILFWLSDHPMRRISKLKEPKGRIRYLSDEERNSLLSACKASRNPHLYPIVILALSTGMRKNEVRWLRWADVDLNRGTATLRETKNGQTRVVPISGHAKDLLAALETGRSDRDQFIFPGNNSTAPIDIRTAWEMARDRAGIRDFRFHDLRHSAASYLAMNGASL